MKAPSLLTWASLPSAFALNIPLQGFLSPHAETPLPAVKPSGRETCPQAPKVELPNDGLHSSLVFLKDGAFRARQVDRLSRAVQVPTTVGDYATDPYDKAFEPFVEHINRLGLLYTFQGVDTTRKPILFTAHQDVVPIDDPSDWAHPPFEGHFDGEWLWGRGASDCKNSLIGLLSALEDLVSQGWNPQRTVLLAFGFDEESHGFLGAGSISKFLEERYGKDSIEFLLDEGGMGLSSLGGDSDSAEEILYALPAVGEKGNTDLVLELAVPGGHSSIPPAHTGIGIIAEILYELERQELFTAKLDSSHPTYGKLECQARYSPERDAESLAEAVSQSRGSRIRYTLQTSQAADLISGGVKTNALPEKISAIVNYRVALHQTPDLVRERAVRIISPIAERHNISIIQKYPGVPNKPIEHPDRTLTLYSLSEPLAPAPISPTDPLSSKVWARFAGVTRSVFESHPDPTKRQSSLAHGTESEEVVESVPRVVVTGDVMTGNTDTRFYWSLTENIYRWSPSREGTALNIHTVDERVQLDAHLEGIMLYYGRSYLGSY
ncbi:hypothetical protein N7470_005154 [Penicillium chermesinum]|nr:hypothetical protein N7470_005154 [Penicillium chermesinum]